MKIKNKGKVYPTPPPFSTSSSSRCVNGDGYLSVLKLLPAAILVLVSALSPEDREVLAYLITRSLKTPTTTSASVSSCGKSRSPSAASSSPNTSMLQASKKKTKKSGSKGETHRPPVFDCDCFDCYTSYWLRWDSSPNRELIHQVIESFEDHFTSGEASASQKPKRNSGRGKKKEKSGRRAGDKLRPVEASSRPDEPDSVPEIETPEPEVAIVSSEVIPGSDASPASSPGRLAGEGGAEVGEKEKEETVEKSSIAVRTPAESGLKGLARKGLPDLLGLFNSRLWSLWNPNA